MVDSASTFSHSSRVLATEAIVDYDLRSHSNQALASEAIVDSAPTDSHNSQLPPTYDGIGKAYSCFGLRALAPEAKVDSTINVSKPV